MPSLKKIFNIIYITIVLLSCVWYIHANADSLKEGLARLDFYWLAASVILSAPIYIGLLLNFVSTQKGVEQPARPLSWSQWFCGFIFGHVGRYVPGKVAMIFGRINYFQKFGFSKKALTISTLYENLFLVIVATMLAFPSLVAALQSDKDVMHYVVAGVAFMVMALLFIGSPYFEKSFLLALRIFKMEAPENSLFLTKGQIFSVLPYAFLVAVSTGLALFALLRCFTPLPWTFYNVSMVISAYSFASAAGILALFAPSGIGVREGVAAYLLGGCLHVVNPALIVVALVLFRIVLMAAEFLMLGAAWMLADRSAADTFD
jgi:hypothetical protein